MADRAHLEHLTKKLADDGKLIESGWIGFRIAVAAELQEFGDELLRDLPTEGRA